MNHLRVGLCAAVAWIASFTTLQRSSAEGALLVERGAARGEIVIGDKPARMAKLAARELQTYVEKISGAKLEIVPVPTDGRPHIFVGKSRFTDTLQLSTAGLENGAFRMASGDGWLALLGPDEDYVPIEPWGRLRGTAEAQRVNQAWDKFTGDTFWDNCNGLYSRYHKDLDVWDFDDTGTLNAVYEYLRSLGVRWFFPGELGEVVPRLASIPLPQIDTTVRPDFALRRFSYYTDHLGLGEIGIWNLRLGTHQAHKLIGVTQPAHGLKFVLWREEMKRAHPEMYLLLPDGSRNLTHKQTGAPCLSSPVLKEKQLKYSRAMFDHYRQPMLSIDVVDGYGGMHCNHPECQSKYTTDRGWPGSMSDYVWGYLDDVARQLHRSHPDRLVSGLAYSAYRMPPEKIATMSPNLAIIETRARSRFYDEAVRDASREFRAAWLKRLPSKKYFTWDYYLYAVPEDVGPPAFYPRQIADDLRELRGISLGDTIEVYQHQPGTESQFGYDPLAIEHLNIYVTSRLWWDCRQDVDTLLEDYYTGFYGPAREAMKAFIEYSEQNWMFMTQDAMRIQRAFELLAAAQASVEPESVYGRRIAKIAELMKPLQALQRQLGRKHESDMAYRVLETWQAGGRTMKEKPLDGRLTTEFWPDVRVTSLAPLMPGTRAKVDGQFQVLREGDILYFGIKCQEPDMAGLQSGAKGKTGGVFDGDYVTLLLETPSHAYYEIAVDSQGRVQQIDHGEGAAADWKSGAEVAVHRGKDFWSVEIRLPIAGEGARLLDRRTGVDGNRPKELFPWYFNVCRSRVRGGAEERTAYSSTGPETFHRPEKFAKLWAK